MTEQEIIQTKSFYEYSAVKLLKSGLQKYIRMATQHRQKSLRVGHNQKTPATCTLSLCCVYLEFYFIFRTAQVK